MLGQLLPNLSRKSARDGRETHPVTLVPAAGDTAVSRISLYLSYGDNQIDCSARAALDTAPRVKKQCDCDCR